jgi:uncharacterized DUF497 family protein
MEIEFDPAKDALNIRHHDGLSLSLAARMDWENAVFTQDRRFDYDEVRINATVPLADGLYFVTLTERGEKMRVISLRYATRKENGSPMSKSTTHTNSTLDQQVKKGLRALLRLTPKERTEVLRQENERRARLKAGQNPSG